MNFTKDLLSMSSFYHFKNTVKYDIIEEPKLRSTLIIYSTLTADILMEHKTYHIKPVSNFFTIKGFEIISEQGKIGKIEYWGWTCRNPKLVIKNQKEDEVWIFDRNEPGFFKTRNNPYTTHLRSKDKLVSYDIQLNDFLEGNSKNECLRKVEGMAYYNEDDRLVCLLGIYLNELLIFDEMEK